ncbi:hypothetical protein UUU_19940 [Klebsiella pneumoniae subsp. pneumoniae DSM 30104 = JCM 1662 = NBRC 14940]|nr:hypothetical protein UUU_19940 [Klebsiella pneumoniae subsp. pneumoniae DSM 30104 = JCM 1662 = NBRC 14940]
MPQRRVRSRGFKPLIMSCLLSESDVAQIAQTFRDRLQAACGMARVALLFNGYPALIPPAGKKVFDSRIVNGAAAERAHHPFGAGSEEVDTFMDSALINLRVDILEVQIVQAEVIAIQPVERIHPGVIEMSGVQTQPGDVVRDIVGQPLDLIREFNAAPGVRMDNRPHTVLLPGEGAKGDNVLHHALPVFVIEARSQRAAPGKARPFGVAEVDNHQIGRLERAARDRFGSGYLRQIAADLMGQRHQGGEMGLAHQIVKDRAGDQRQLMLLQRRAQAGRIAGEITPGAELNAAIASLRRLLQHGSPGREVRVFRVIDAPAAGGVSDRMYHVGFLFHTRDAAEY